MPLIVEDRVKESSTTTGTGAFTLAGALTGFRTFASEMTTNDTCYYVIQGVDANGVPTGEWETGLGTYSGVNTLTRTTVHRSSNSDTVVTFSAGTKHVFIDVTQAYLGTVAKLAGAAFTGSVTNTQTLTSIANTTQYATSNQLTSNPASASEALFVAAQGTNTFTGFGFTGAGHAIGSLWEMVVNAATRTVALVIGQEGLIKHLDGTITRAIASLGSLNTLSSGKTITTFEGVTSHAGSAAVGTVGTYKAFNTDTSGASTLAISGNYFGMYFDNTAATVTGVQYGLYAESFSKGSASAVVSSPQNSSASRYGNYFNGTVQHVFGGNVRIGGSSDPTVPLDVTGNALISGTLGVSGVSTFNDQQIVRGMLKDCGLVFLDKGNSGTSTQTLDYTAAQHQRIAVTGNHTIATSNWPPSGNTGELLLELVNGAAFTITWPTINWVKTDGTTTTTFASNGVTLQASGVDFALLWTRDGGTTIYGKWLR